MIKLKFFFAGGIAALLALITEAAFSIFISNDSAGKILTASLGSMVFVAFLEEFCKFLTLEKASLKFKNINLSFYALFFGAGFSFLEILLNSTKLLDFSKNIFFAFLAITFLHLITSLLLALFLNLKSKSFLTKLGGIFSAGITHLLFNMALFYNFPLWKISLILIIILFGLYFKIKDK